MKNPSDCTRPSETGYSCPNCNTTCSDKTLVSKTKPEFKYFPDPCYCWDETHKCSHCGETYIIHNGT